MKALRFLYLLLRQRSIARAKWVMDYENYKPTHKGRD